MDCRGRGESELGNDSLTYMQMANDIADILNYLHIDSAYMVGRSDGGIISLLMAIYYPQKVKKVVAFAANLTPDTVALYPSFYNEVKRERRLADEMLVLVQFLRMNRHLDQIEKLEGDHLEKEKELQPLPDNHFDRGK